MSVLWPRLTGPVAAEEFNQMRADAEDVRAKISHPAQSYSPVGGRRIADKDIQRLINIMTTLAHDHGYPRIGTDRQRIAFDRLATDVVRDHMDLSWYEAGSRDVWSFLAIVVLPHLTSWRFGPTNVERWIATDLTRHTWGRLWWRGVVFESDRGLLDLLTESDLNQLLERRSIGGDPRMTCALGRAVANMSAGGHERRSLIRDTTARLLRRLAFVDSRALNDAQINELCRTLVYESCEYFRIAPGTWTEHGTLNLSLATD
jgi:hypothetical protein